LEVLVLVTINGTRIYFDIEGTGLKVSNGRLSTKPTIVALHGGLGFDHGYLRPGLSALSEIAQVVYVDLRGQGRSDRPLIDTCSLEQMADDVAALCFFLGIEQPILFGHSAGGFVALHAALRHPKLVKGMILSGSSPSVQPVKDHEAEPAPSLASRAGPEVLAIAGKVFGGDITAETIAAFLEQVGPFYAGPSYTKAVCDLLSLTSVDIEMMKHFMANIAPDYDLVDKLSGIAAPTLVMVGGYDWVCPPRASRAIARGIPGAKLVEFETAGHFVFSEVPAQFFDRVAEFLSAFD
jgi:proline iminopeptidase